jgi:hypothetical protein
MQIYSKNKKIVVFSDWHQESDKLRKILKAESDADYFVDLGDEFDSFDYDSDYDVQKAAELRKEMLWNPKFTVLWGNHTINYSHKWNNNARCSGYELRKQRVVDEILRFEDYEKFKWFCWVDSFLCSHAGLHPYFLPPMIDLNKNGVTDWLVKETEEATIKLNSNEGHWTFRAGKARSGIQRVGGLLWLDFDREFKPINRVPQIVGHSPRQSGCIETYEGGSRPKNWCIDTFLNEWLVIENGVASTRSYSAL